MSSTRDGDHRHDAAGVPERVRGTRRGHDQGDQPGVRRGAARRPHRPRPQPLGVHARRRAREARRAGARRRRARRSRRYRSTCTTACTRWSERSTSRRSSTSVLTIAARRSPRRSCSPIGWGRSSGCPCSCTGRSAAGARARSCAEADPPSSRGGSRPTSSSPTSVRARLHPTAGAVLVAARPPLVAFNVELAADRTLDQARALAAEIRDGRDPRTPGVRAIGLWLDSAGHAQVSTNVEDYRASLAGGRRRRDRGARRPRRDSQRRARRAGAGRRFRGLPGRRAAASARQTIEDALARRPVNA